MLLLKPIGRGNWSTLTLRLDGTRQGPARQREREVPQAAASVRERHR